MVEGGPAEIRVVASVPVGPGTLCAFIHDGAHAIASVALGRTDAAVSHIRRHMAVGHVGPYVCGDDCPT